MRSEYIKSRPARTSLSAFRSFVSAPGPGEAMQSVPSICRTAHLNNSAKGNYRPVLYGPLVFYFAEQRLEENIFILATSGFISTRLVL